jgi:2-dehydropantoate 2-reductase
MRILVLGAGAIGGYYGGLLAQAGGDVTFLVRPRRAEQLRGNGLVIHASDQDIRRPVNILLADQLDRTFDIILVANKAYDLASAIDAIAPAVGGETAIVPLLNGLAHLDALDARFGAARVLGGVCYIAVTLTDNGDIHRLSPLDTILFGDRAGRPSRHIDALAALFAKTRANAKASADIMQDLWEKWVMLAAGAALTCLMRATVGEIMATQDGAFLSAALIDECVAIAAANGHAPSGAALQRTRQILGEPGSSWAASMMRDIEKDAPRLESDHIIGDLLRRGRDRDAAPLLRAAYSQLQIYQARHQPSRER